MQKIYKIILQWKPVVFVIELSKKIILPGFDGLPLYDVVVFFIKGIQKGSLTTRASSLAFNFFLAIFPGIIFLFSLIPYIPIDDFQDQLLSLMKDMLPYNAFQAMKSTIEDILMHQRRGLLSFGFILTFYFATNGVNAMINAFNSSYYSIETRSPLMQRLVSFILVFILTFLVLFSIALIVFSGLALDYLVEKGILQDAFTIYLLLIGKWLTIVGLFFFTFSFLYYYGPSRKSKFRFISPGSTLATILSIITSLGFAYYVNNFGQYNKLYGSIGTIVVVLLWLYFNSIILLLGFELNASIRNAKKQIE